MATPDDLLNRAAELIGERGWHQGGLEDEHGALCALGALGRAKYELFDLNGDGLGRQAKEASDAYGEAYTQLVYTINPTATGNWAEWGNLVSVPAWNDDETRTAEDVILALKNAAHR